MTLPLSRFCHAVVAWLRRRYSESGDSEGWEKVMAYIYAPPAVSAADEVEARARAQVGDQRAAAAAFMGATS